MKYSKIAGVTRWSGGTIVLQKGQSIEDEHPLVAERPEIWTDEDPGASIRGASGGVSRVQTAMQRPGQPRSETPPAQKSTPAAKKTAPAAKKATGGQAQ